MTKDNDDNNEDDSIYDIDIAACDLLANANYKDFLDRFNAIVARVWKLEQVVSSMNKLNRVLNSQHKTMDDQLTVARTEISNLMIKHDVMKEEAVKSRNKITELGVYLYLL
jgi:hypothetical protein